MPPTIVAWVVAVAAIAVAAVLLRSLLAARRRATEEAARNQEALRAAEAEKTRAGALLEATRDEAKVLVARVGTLESELGSTRAELEAARSELDSMHEQSRQEHASQRQFFARKARETYEVFRHQLAVDGFPEKLEAVASPGGGRGLGEEARKLQKELESWMGQGAVEDPAILHTLALVEYSRGETRHAETRLRAAARISGDALLHENLGDLLRLTGRTRRAVDSYRNAAKNAPEASPIHRKLGLALFESRDYAASVKPLQSALAANPSDPDLHLKTARALLEAGDLQKATEVAREGGRRFPGNALFPATAIVAFARMKRFKDAQKAFEKAVDIDPRSPEAHFAHGFALLDETRTEEAKQAFDTALSCDPQRPEPHYGLGLCAALAGDHERAIEHLKAAVERKPDYAEAWYAMKSSYEALKKFEAAVEALNKAMALNPRHSA